MHAQPLSQTRAAGAKRVRTAVFVSLQRKISKGKEIKEKEKISPGCEGGESD